MNKMLLLLAVLAIVAGCAAPQTTPVKESPTQVPAPAPTPVPTTTPTPAPAPATDTEVCEADCMAQCAEDGEHACTYAADYDTCVANCGEFNKDGSCKGGCATGTPIECAIIMKSGCKKDCPKICATS